MKAKVLFILAGALALSGFPLVTTQEKPKGQPGANQDLVVERG